MARILVVDDEALILNVLKTVLMSDGHETASTQDAAAALQMIFTQKFDLLISDIRMSPMDGIELLKQVRAKNEHIPVILMTGYGTVKSAIEALSLNVFDYIPKPFKVEDFLSTVKQALLYGQTTGGESSSNADKLPDASRLGELIAASPAMLEACDMIKRVAPVDVPVFISGEYGAGKETVARTIHDLSLRKDKQFVTVACGELPEPLFDALLFGAGEGGASFQSETKSFVDEAQGGTLFLNDADLIPPLIQDRLLDVIQNAQSGSKAGEGVRFIGATTNKPDQLVMPDSQGPNLFQIVGAVEIKIRPLRERREDILPLALHILQLKTPEGQTPPVLAPDARDALVQYGWPGNISELDKAIEHGIDNLAEGRITRQSLPQRIQTQVVDADAKAKRDQIFGKNKSLKAFLSKPLQQLKSAGVRV